MTGWGMTWDPLGCGESDQPMDPALWTIERLVDEMEAVRVGLGPRQDEQSGGRRHRARLCVFPRGEPRGKDYRNYDWPKRGR